MVVPVGTQQLVCVRWSGETILVVAVEPVHRSVPVVVLRLLSLPLRRWYHRVLGRRLDPGWPDPDRQRRGPYPVSRGIQLMDLVVELRLVFRVLRRHAAISLLAVMVLGLGIGLPASMFSLLNGAVLRGLPVRDPGRIMHLERRPIGAHGEGWGAAPRDYRAWQDQQRTFESLAAFDPEAVTLRVGGSAERYDAAYVTPNTFTVLGVTAEVGRYFGADDAGAGAAPVVVLGHSIWRDRFASDRNVVGRIVWVNGAARTVIGVMPEGFRFPSQQDLWLPLSVGPAAEQQADFPNLDVFGRLRRGVSLAEARAEFAVIAQHTAEEYPATNRNMTVVIKPFTERMVGETPMRQMYLLLAAVLLVLVVACTNVADLLLVRAVQRVRDLAIRAALGASRGRLLLQLLLESAVLSVAGGAVGVLVALAATGAFRRGIGSRLPYYTRLSLDGHVLAFILVLTLAASLLAGMLPALKVMGTDLSGTLRDESRGSSGLRISRLMHGLVVLQIGLSLALLVMTALLAQSVGRVRDVALGFATSDVLTAHVALPAAYDQAARERFLDRFLQGLEAVPGAKAVALASDLPADRAPNTRFALPGVVYNSPADQPRARRAAVSADFFRALAVAPVRGRVFDSRDRSDGAPVALVNERFAARFLGGRDPVGTRIRLGNAGSGAWRTIVGVVPDLWMAALDASGDRNPPGIYVPLFQSIPTTVGILVRSRGAPLGLAPAVRQAAYDQDPDVPVFNVRTMARLIEDNSWFYGMAAAIMAVCGLAALFLAATGLYGVVAFSVGRRTKEFGIRMAMGAAPRDVLRLVLQRGAYQVLIGLGLGLALGLFLARGVAGLLFEVDPGDPWTFAGVAGLLLLVAFGASLVPALRASRIDPLTALHSE